MTTGHILYLTGFFLTFFALKIILGEKGSKGLTLGISIVSLFSLAAFGGIVIILFIDFVKRKLL